ncbi:HD domain-containing protein [Marinilactibacillus kalidii]|uniref:HD domain-containing protein n=1 Tax=Marinilactibacillus kalidii TaxID=2820274 RepID=UPI001ABEAA08|nr:HD domain-containing protein [Marinilactibacillus kalidii]
MQNIEAALKLLRNTYNESKHFEKNPSEKEYRYQHSFRVASIADKISTKENLDNEVTVIGALLHDISYANAFQSEQDWKNHGRNAAAMVASFLEELPLLERQKEEIFIGIASHVDGIAGREGELTVNARTISDSDHLDRIDTYRTFETLSYHKFYDKPTREKIVYLEERLSNQTLLIEDAMNEFATKTAKEMWKQRLEEQARVYSQLLEQLRTGSFFAAKIDNRQE